MKIVILFGGGDGGGLIITENGVRPIPPFDPSILLNLKSASALVQAFTKASDQRMRAKLSKLATNLSNLAVEQVEQVVGPLSGEQSLIFQDDDGGFTCGSTGKPPIPLPWPPSHLPSVPDLIASGMISVDLVEFVQKVHAKKIVLTEAFENPAKVAKQLGVTLSEQSVKDLHILAPSKLASIKNPAEREVVSFFHKVATDGRFVETWLSRPYEVSQELKYKLSEDALGILVNGGSSASLSDARSSAICAGIVWAGICIVIGILLVAPERPIDQIINDRSGMEKF